MSYTAIKAALVTVLEAGFSGLNAYADPPDGTLDVPCALIMPSSGQAAEYLWTFDQVDAKYHFDVIVLVNRGDLPSASANLDQYIDSGASGVRGILRANATLSGAVSDLIVHGARKSGQYMWANVPYYGCTFDVEVYSDN